jgi:hypothetical protein
VREAPSKKLLPSEPIVEPTRPAADASLADTVTPASGHNLQRSLYTAFNVPRYQELLEAEWEQVEHWFQSQLERKR